MPVATRNAMAMAQREGKALGEEGAFYKDTIAITTQGKRETCPKNNTELHYEMLKVQ